MSIFKFACPVCGQHITADSAAAGSELNCPTCFRKIIVPQAPASSDPKFILSAAEASKPRPSQAGSQLEPLEPVRERAPVPLWAVLAAVAVCAAGATLVLFRGKIFHHGGGGNTNPQKVEVVIPESRQVRPLRGGIGLGAWNTTVEYSNVVVSKGAQTLYQSDFSSNAAGWQTANGNWIATNGVFRQTAIAENCRAITGDSNWSDYTVRLRARKLAGHEGFLILFNVADGRNWTWWNLGGWNNTRHGLENSISGAKSQLGRSVPGQIERGRWYDVRVELAGSNIRCYLNDALIEDVNYQPAQPPPSSRQSASSSSPPTPPSSPGASEGPWSLDLAAASFPVANAAGTIRGATFACNRSVLQGGTLHLRQGETWPPDLGVSVYFRDKQNEALQNKSFNVVSSDTGVPRVTLRWKENQEPATKSFNRQYAMKLEFGGIITNHISGKIYLCLPDESKSYVAGTFNAELRNPSPPK